MTTYARIVTGCAVDITTSNPATLFHEDVAAEFVEVPDGTQHGDTVDADGVWTKYVAPPAPPAPAHKPPVVTPPQFKLIMLDELPEIMAKVATDPIIATFMDVVNDPRLTEVDLSLQSVQNGLQYCLKQIGRTDEQVAARMTTILSGVWT